MKVLVTGGAGYIGSHTCHMLIEQGHEVIVIDNLENGHKEFLPTTSKLYVLDINDIIAIDKIFEENKYIDAVIHFAGYTEVGKSMKDPGIFFENNVSNGLNLLNVMKKYSVNKIVFSSSAAVYGNPEKIPIIEKSKKKPTNNYGLTKLMFEQVLDAYQVYGLKNVCLRYFNACGAGYGIIEKHNPETHLIPLILQVASGKKKNINIFGTDYKTKDGTCIRDYIHVLDLAEAHIQALNYLVKHDESIKLNLGTGIGLSVNEIIEKCREITGHSIPVIESDRRHGDPAELVASPDLAFEILDWKPKYSSINNIIKTAGEFNKND